MTKERIIIPYKQILNVQYAIAPDGTILPSRIDVGGKEYPIMVLRFREVSPARWRYTVRMGERKLNLFRAGHDWWAE